MTSTRARQDGSRRWYLGAALIALLLVGLGLGRVELDTDTDTFLPTGDPTVRALDAKARSFGGDPVIVLLESAGPHELLKEEQLTKLVALEGRLGRLGDVAAVYGPGTVLNQLAGAAQDMLAQISGRRDGLRNEAVVAARKDGASRTEAEAAGRNAVVAFDERYGSLLVSGLPAGLPTLRNPRFVETVMYGGGSATRSEWRFVVPADDTVAIIVRPRENLDQHATADLVEDVRSAVNDSGLRTERTIVTGAPALTAGLASRANDELPALGALAVGLVGLVYLVLPWTRRRSRLRPLAAALMGTAATLSVFGWLGRPLSLGVVAILPILLGIGSDFPVYLSRAGRQRRALVAAVAAAAAFASLAVSPLPFVSELGLGLALGIAFTAVAALVLRRLLGPVAPPAAAIVPSPEVAGAVPSWARVAAGSLAGGVAVLGWVVLPGLPVQAQPDELAQGLPELADSEYAESVLGSSGEVNILVRGQDLARPEVLAWLRHVEERVVRELGNRAHPVISTARLFRFLGENPTPAQVEAALSLMPSYLTSAVLRTDRTEAVLVLGVEFSDVADLGRLLESLDEITSAPPPGTDVEVVGLPVSAARGLDLVSEGRLWINVAGIVGAALVLLIGLRSARDTLAAVATVLVATGWLTLVVWATAGALSPLTVAIGSLVTATGVEFAVMLSARERGLKGLLTVGTAALAGTVGYLVLALSQLAVLREFGLLLACGVACSFLAALVVTRIVLPHGVVAQARNADESGLDAEATQTTAGHNEKVLL